MCYNYIHGVNDMSGSGLRCSIFSVRRQVGLAAANSGIPEGAVIGI